MKWNSTTSRLTLENRASSAIRDEGSRDTAVNCGGSVSLETMLMRVQEPPVEVSVISRRASGSRNHPTIVPACGMCQKKLICWQRAIRSVAASFLTIHLATQSDLKWTLQRASAKGPEWTGVSAMILWDILLSAILLIARGYSTLVCDIKSLLMERSGRVRHEDRTEYITSGVAETESRGV
jgi:hypothetical protein